MKILILSRDANYYSTKRLVQEARKLRHKAVVIDPLECEISVGATFNAKRSTLNAPRSVSDLTSFDVVIPRIGIVGVDYALLVAHQLEFMGKPMLNSARALTYTKNKFLALQILCKSGIPVPETMMIRNPSRIKAAIKKLGGLPVVLKLFRGSQGKGVMLAENLSSVESILTAVWAIGFDVILQEYLKETKGEDIRLLVLGNEVIGAMRRRPAKNDFRSNVHQGGRMKKVTLTAEEKQMALEATRALGLKLAGIDIMRTRKGPMVLEANGSPGFEGLEKLTRLNIAQRIVEYACRQAEF
ncbi:MAG: RimK family alpha-L-glutamate ligase [Planctomycetota bacterium]